MKTIKLRGLVLREFETGEADKRLLLLCKGQGRVMAYARGARKPRSKFIAAAQIFTYSDYILAEGRGFYSVAQADVIENFYNLRLDYDRLNAAHEIVSVCEKNLLEDSNCDELLLLTLKSLSNLAKGKIVPNQILSVFLLRFFDLYGLRPNADACAVCGERSGKFFWGTEGLLCEKHGMGISLSPAAVAAISFILNSGLSQSFLFDAHEKVLEELNSATQFLLKHSELI
jgi:DNA repair protein RecO (recombination protein O)